MFSPSLLGLFSCFLPFIGFPAFGICLFNSFVPALLVVWKCDFIYVFAKIAPNLDSTTVWLEQKSCSQFRTVQYSTADILRVFGAEGQHIPSVSMDLHHVERTVRRNQ